MKTALYLSHAAELYTNEGPTGEFVDVTHGNVEDYGSNVLFSGTADQCAAKKYRIPTRLVPTKWNKVKGIVAGADHAWQLVVE